MRRLLIAGNWKMNKTISEAVSLVESLYQEIKSKGLADKCDVLVCPPFTALAEVNRLEVKDFIALGAQNMYWEDKGAFTGEISPLMVKDAGCQYVVLGHSERRHVFNETNEMINNKMAASIKHGLKPILCVGEKLSEREAGDTSKIVEHQLKEGLSGIQINDMRKVTIAYEPVWAIGTGVNATPDQAQEVHNFIRGLIKDYYNETIASDIRILYGGSVKPANAGELTALEDVDGALVGGASLDTANFVGIIENSKN